MIAFKTFSRIGLVVLVLALHSSSIFAQKPVWGIFAGPQMTSANYHITEVKQSVEHKFGFHAGVGMKTAFETNLSFSPALLYSLKGYKVQFDRPAYPPDLQAVDNNTTIHTVELAMLLQYDMGKRPSHFFIKFGPSFDFQLSGKEEFNLKNGGNKTQKMIYSYGEYGRWAANLLVQLGFESAGGFVISGNYGLGLTDINNADYGPRINHRVFGLTIGKYFNRKSIIIDTRNRE